VTGNRYPKTSELYLRAVRGEKRSLLADVRFTAPFKITHPFYDADGRLQVMLLNVSAGIMAGDTQRIQIEADDGAHLEILSQSYEKIHKMEAGECARRYTVLQAGADAVLFYTPLPSIPFAGSALESETDIRLTEGTALIFYSDILACGRVARGERFTYARYRNRVRAYLDGRLIYLDNAVFEPDAAELEGFCLYEGYTHLLNIFAAGSAVTGAFLEQVNAAIQAFDGVKAGASLTGSGAVCVRALGNGAEQLMELEHLVKRLLTP
jgi:urease accessory protein